VLLSMLARARQDSVVRFLARHHRGIEILSGTMLIAAGLWDLSMNWESILLTFGI
jgi:cytochrome c biogenesis protein CcdA